MKETCKVVSWYERGSTATTSTSLKIKHQFIKINNLTARRTYAWRWIIRWSFEKSFVHAQNFLTTANSVDEGRRMETIKKRLTNAWETIQTTKQRKLQTLYVTQTFITNITVVKPLSHLNVSLRRMWTFKDNYHSLVFVQKLVKKLKVLDDFITKKTNV